MYLTLGSHILSRSMEADILESKKDLYLVQKYGGRYFEKVLFINLFHFVVPIGITACSIIIDVALVIKTAERYFVYFIAAKLMSLASYSFHFCGAFVRYLLECFYSLHA